MIVLWWCRCTVISANTKNCIKKDSRQNQRPNNDGNNIMLSRRNWGKNKPHNKKNRNSQRKHHKAKLVFKRHQHNQKKKKRLRKWKSNLNHQRKSLRIWRKWKRLVLITEIRVISIIGVKILQKWQYKFPCLKVLLQSNWR